MSKILFIIILFQIQLVATAQRVKYMSVSKQVKIYLLSGTYRSDGIHCKFKKNMTCKVTFTGPRKLIFKGQWNICQDTILCSYHHVNLVLKGKNKELKQQPYKQKFVVVNDMLYLKEDNDGVRIAFNKE